MKGALSIAYRDLLKFYKQPVVMVTSVVGPFLTLFLLGTAFGGAVTHAPIAIVQESNGPFSSNLIGILQNQLSCQVGGINCENAFQLTFVPTLDTALQMLHQGVIKGIVFIPWQFDSTLAAGSKATITVTLDNTDPISAGAISSEVAAAVQQLSPLAQTSSSGNSNVTTDLENAYGTILYISFMAPGSYIQAIMFVAIIAGGVQIVVDRERGVLEGYLVTPLTKTDIVLGVLFSGVVKALFTAVLVLVLAIVVAGVRPTSMFPTVHLPEVALTLLTLFLIAVGLIAMMTAYAVRTKSADLYRVTLFPVNLILYYTSGAIYPLVGMPAWMQQVSVVNPMTYAVHALRMLMYKGAGLQAVAGDFVFLAVFSLLMVGVAIVSFRRGL